MAQPDEQPGIDVWSNSDAADVIDRFTEYMLRIFTNPINRHDIATLSEPSGYLDRNGTIVVIITEGTLRMMNAVPTLAFGRLVSSCANRYYVDESDLLEGDHNTRVDLLSAENDSRWIKINLNDGSAMQQISHIALKGTDSISPKGSRIGRKQKTSTSKGKRGLFTIIPNEFSRDLLKRQRTEDGVVVIDASVFENGLSWAYRGDPVTAYLVNHTDRNDKQNIELTLTAVVPYKVFKFKLPDDLKPSTYMMHVRDGDTQQAYELGNRSIKIKQALPINSDLFSEDNLTALASVPDLSTLESCKTLDDKLCDCFDKSQLPLKLPQYLGRKCPTLLHVACHYGLENLFMKMMDSFCSLDSLNINNVDIQKPGDLATAQGHAMLAESLSNQLIIQDMYVTHSPAGVKEFHDIYNTVSFEPIDASDIVYVTNASLDSEDHPDDMATDDGIYFEAETQKPMPARYSVGEQRSAPIVVSPVASRTLPRSGMNSNAEMLGTQNGVASEILPQSYLRDWTKRLQSFKALGLEDRLEGQKKLVQDQESVIKSAPPIAPRTRIISTPEGRGIKRLPAPPPPAAIKGSAPPIPIRRQVSKDFEINRNSDYEIPIMTLPGSPRSESASPFVPPRLK